MNVSSNASVSQYAAINFEQGQRVGIQTLFLPERELVIPLRPKEWHEGEGEHALYYLGYFIRKQKEFASKLY